MVKKVKQEPKIEVPTDEKKTWVYPGQASTFFDPLLTSLVFITKMQGRPIVE